VTLVNIRGGQDGGFLFLQPTVDAMVYAGLVGIDVINMSFYTDPWLFNCLDNPADSPEVQAEQRTVRVATQRAINFARAPRGHPDRLHGQRPHRPRQPDRGRHQPRLPARHQLPADGDNSCITVPVETRGVISISALGPSYRLTDQYRQPENMNLSPMPQALAEAALEDPANVASSCGTARARPVATTSTCREPRWPRPTPPGWPR